MATVASRLLERHFEHGAKQVSSAPPFWGFRMYVRIIFDAPSFDAEFVKLLKGQAIRAGRSQATYRVSLNPKLP